MSARYKIVVLAILCSTIALPKNAWSIDIYVNNQLGSDLLDGEAAELLENETGPLKSITGALRIARRGDTVHIANTGKPYHESVTLVGNRHSGWPESPFVIEGNGATLSGLQNVPDMAWKPVRGPIWKVMPWRKGYYQLLIDGKALPRANAIDNTFSNLAEGEWTVRHGDIIVHTGLAGEPFNQGYQVSAKTVGITLYRVHDVLVHDLTVKNFLLDGINAHDLCRNVVLSNITATENTRSGITVAGSSDISLRGSKLNNNGEAQLLILEKGIANVHESEFSEPPVVKD